MTSFAFILGVVPLVIARGAGAEMRQALGTAVFAGMLGVTLFGIFLTPVFFYVLQWFGRDIPSETKHSAPTPPDSDLPRPAGHEAGIQVRPDHPPLD
jgi:multidrug efflux pump